MAVACSARPRTSFSLPCSHPKSYALHRLQLDPRSSPRQLLCDALDPLLRPQGVSLAGVQGTHGVLVLSPEHVLDSQGLAVGPDGFAVAARAEPERRFGGAEGGVDGGVEVCGCGYEIARVHVECVQGVQLGFPVDLPASGQRHPSLFQSLLEVGVGGTRPVLRF